jgi:centromeric protein E
LRKAKKRYGHLQKKSEQLKKDLKRSSKEVAALERHLAAKDREIEALHKTNEEMAARLKAESQKARAEIERLAAALRTVEESLGILILFSFLICGDKPLIVSSALTIECVICGEDMATVVMLPCLHQVLCKACMNRVDICPICRVRITERISSYCHPEKEVFKRVLIPINWEPSSRIL